MWTNIYYCRIGSKHAISCRSFDWNQCQSCKKYQAGKYNPNWPVPTLIGEVAIYPNAVVFYDANMYEIEPFLTYWNESDGLPLPVDHGLVFEMVR